MLITFKSKADADIPMFFENAQQLLALIGKKLEPASAPRGIITAAEVPTALAILKNAAEQASSDARRQAADEGEHHDAAMSINLAQRAYPLIEMLARAAEKKADVVWGV